MCFAHHGKHLQGLPAALHYTEVAVDRFAEAPLGHTLSPAGGPTEKSAASAPGGALDMGLHYLQ